MSAGADCISLPVHRNKIVMNANEKQIHGMEKLLPFRLSSSYPCAYVHSSIFVLKHLSSTAIALYVTFCVKI